ncbi:MAG: hypothetical protein ACQEXE_26725 [Bacillota bacterium]
MKRKLIVVAIICLMGFFSIILLNPSAFDNSKKELPEFTYSSKEKNQMFGYFIIDLYHNEIMNAIKEYYNDSKINGYATPEPPHYNMVSITQIDLNKNKDKDLEKYSYVLKITLLPSYNDGTILGEDTLYFAAEPFRQTMKDLPKEYPPIELIKYEHKNPPKDK